MNLRPMITVSLAAIALMLLAGAWAWLSLPPGAQVPIHWGVDGQPDGYADKTVGLFLLPGVAVGVVLLFVAIPRIEPRRANLERSGKAYGAMWIGVMVLLGALQLLAVAFAMGATFDLTDLALIGTGALFVVIGNYLPKVRPNYLVGIRTPWTLTSDLAWARTHRVGGRLFVIEGVAFAALGVIGVPGEWLVAAIIAAVAVLLVVAFAYSYVVWKSDPDRRTA
jgi:uncharacterized membrane protein